MYDDMVENLHRGPDGRYTPADPAIERFTASYKIDDDGCWIWTEGFTGAGYGAFYPSSRQVGAHVWSFRHHIGPIPPGMVVDHQCEKRACTNPRCLKLATRGGNVLRSEISKAGINQRKSKCDRGHELSGENLITQPNSRNPALPPWRSCRECKNQTRRERRHAKREAI